MTKEMLLNTYLKQLRLPTILKNYREAAERDQTFEEFLLCLFEQEVTQREENNLKRRLKHAKFPSIKTLESFDFSAIPSLKKKKVLELSRAGFIEKFENIIIVGNHGTGKTHLATSLALAACRQGYKVRFYNVAGLVNELIMAQSDHNLLKFEKQWLKFDLVVLDELGYLPFSSIGSQLLFQFCSSRYERGSMILTTNLEFAEWTQVFGEEKLTAALLDRLTHKCHILQMNGDSFRFKQSLQRQQEQ
ncbi:MAG: IS21-like element helper ATPase IstB [Bacillota bacterium]|nr:IS21-like element helper ATPase IstB [Bacillota bacterium]